MLAIAEEDDVNPSMADRTSFEAPKRPSGAGAEGAPSLARRRLLGLLPIQAADCAAPRSSVDAGRPTRAAPTPLEALLDRVVGRLSDTSGNLTGRSPSARDVRLADLVLFHAQPRHGLMIAARALALGLGELFGGAPLDRTELAGATNASICYGDVLGYLTGARHRYGSLTVDAKLGDEWFLLRRTTGDALRIALRAGVKPARLIRRETTLRAATCPSDVIAEVASLQRELSERVWSAPTSEVLTMEPVANPYDPGKLCGDVVTRDCATGVSP